MAALVSPGDHIALEPTLLKLRTGGGGYYPALQADQVVEHLTAESSDNLLLTEV